MNIIVNKRVGGLARTIFTLLAASSQNLRPSSSSSTSVAFQVASAFSDTRIDNTRSVGQISYRCNRHRCSITDRNQNCSDRRFCTRNNHQISKQVQQKQHRTKLNTMSASTNNQNQGDAAFAPMSQPPKTYQHSMEMKKPRLPTLPTTSRPTHSCTTRSRCLPITIEWQLTMRPLWAIQKCSRTR